MAQRMELRIKEATCHPISSGTFPPYSYDDFFNSTTLAALLDPDKKNNKNLLTTHHKTDPDLNRLRGEYHDPI